MTNNYHDPIDSRIDFVNTFLVEMPLQHHVIDGYTEIVLLINERLNIGSSAITLSTGLKKIQGNEINFYWYENNDKILLGAQVERRPYGYVINLVGKDPQLKRSPPFASDLYDSILKDLKKPLRLSDRLLSDTKLSNDGFEIWKKLLSLGHKILIYKKDSPGQTFKEIKTVADLQQYFGPTIDKELYQFVLTESNEIFGDLYSFFGIRRHRELSGIL